MIVTLMKWGPGEQIYSTIALFVANETKNDFFELWDHLKKMFIMGHA